MKDSSRKQSHRLPLSLMIL